MAEPYGPGRERFWVYFAISLPLILCVLGIYTFVDMAQGLAGFSLDSLRAAFRLPIGKRGLGTEKEFQ